jgi:hypothetical protein
LLDIAFFVILMRYYSEKSVLTYSVFHFQLKCYSQVI